MLALAPGVEVFQVDELFGQDGLSPHSVTSGNGRTSLFGKPGFIPPGQLTSDHDVIALENGQ